jgi:WD40 repeat protein
LYDLRNNAHLAQFYSSTEHNLVRNTHEDSDTLNLEIEGLSHSNRLFSVKFDRTNHNIFYTGGWDKVVKFWDKRTGYGVVGSLFGPLVCGDGIDVKVIFKLRFFTLRNKILKFSFRKISCLQHHGPRPILWHSGT